jgi:hypothetical protein
MEGNSRSAALALSGDEELTRTFDQQPVVRPRRVVHTTVFRNVAVFAMALPLSASTPIAIDPYVELMRSGVITSVIRSNRQRRRRISLLDAWNVTGSIYAESHRRRVEQRERVARDFLFWHADE